MNILITLLSCIADVYIFYDFFLAGFDLRDSFKESWKRKLSGLLAVTALFLVNLYGNSYMNLLGSAIITGTYFFVQFQGNTGAKIFYFIVAFLVGISCEFIVMVLMSLPAYVYKGKEIVRLEDIPWQVFTMKLLAFVLFAVIKQSSGRMKKTTGHKIFIYYLCIPVASLGIMLLTYYAGIGRYVGQAAKILLAVTFALMLFGNMAVLRACRLYSEELYTNAEQKLIIARQAMDINYYSQMQKMDERYREFLHNISNHMKTIGGLAKENQNERIVNILKELDIELENNVFTVYCENSIINSVLSEKKAEAERGGIDFDAYVEPGAGLTRITDADLITILGNLLDNALRAAGEADNKSVTVRIYSDNAGSFHVVKIQNFYAGEVHLTEKGFLSTKKEMGMHGIGMKSVEKAAGKYGGYLECFAENHSFTAVVLLSALG